MSVICNPSAGLDPFLSVVSILRRASDDLSLLDARVTAHVFRSPDLDPDPDPEVEAFQQNLTSASELLETAASLARESNFQGLQVSVTFVILKFLEIKTKIQDSARLVSPPC